MIILISFYISVCFLSSSVLCNSYVVCYDDTGYDDTGYDDTYYAGGIPNKACIFIQKLIGFFITYKILMHLSVENFIFVSSSSINETTGTVIIFTSMVTIVLLMHAFTVPTKRYVYMNECVYINSAQSWYGMVKLFFAFFLFANFNFSLTARRRKRSVKLIDLYKITKLRRAKRNTNTSSTSNATTKTSKSYQRASVFRGVHLLHYYS